MIEGANILSLFILAHAIFIQLQRLRKRQTGKRKWQANWVVVQNGQIIPQIQESNCFSSAYKDWAALESAQLGSDWRGFVAFLFSTGWSWLQTPEQVVGEGDKKC